MKCPSIPTHSEYFFLHATCRFPFFHTTMFPSSSADTNLPSPFSSFAEYRSVIGHFLCWGAESFPFLNFFPDELSPAPDSDMGENVRMSPQEVPSDKILKSIHPYFIIYGSTHFKLHLFVISFNCKNIFYQLKLPHKSYGIIEQRLARVLFTFYLIHQ